VYILSYILEHPLAEAALEGIKAGAAAEGSNIFFSVTEMQDRSIEQKAAKARQLADRAVRNNNDIRRIIDGLSVRMEQKKALDSLFSRVHGMNLGIKSESRSHETIFTMRQFLSVTDPYGCRAIADNLSQTLFGLGVVTPEDFWQPSGVAPRPFKTDIHVPPPTLATGSLAWQELEHWLCDVEGVGKNKGTASLNAYVKYTLEYAVKKSLLFLHLLASMASVNLYLAGLGDGTVPASEIRTPAILGKDKEALLLVFLINSLVGHCPEAFFLYNALVQKQSNVRLAMITKYRQRLLEAEPGRDHIPFNDAKDYKRFKAVFADHTHNPDVVRNSWGDRNLTRWWWELTQPSVPYDREKETRFHIRSGGHGNYAPLLGNYEYGYSGGSKLESEVSLGGSSNDMVTWSLYVRKKPGEDRLSFLFYNASRNSCLEVLGINSVDGRQIICWHDAAIDLNDDKAFDLIIPDMPTTSTWCLIDKKP